jgi:DNA-binding transcriptional LysR family regulator
VPLSRDLRMLVVATPDYLKRNGTPRHPRDLLKHQSIGMRMSHGGIYHWELEHGDQKLQMDLPVRMALSEMPAIKQAVLLGLGIGFISEWFVEDELKSGALVPVLVPWCQPFGGLRLYYSGHRFVPARLRALVELIRELRLAESHLAGNRAG